MYFISTWICSKNSKNLFVKIVHRGGHVEIHDRPIVAAELLRRNPKCFVAHPTVFQQPYAVVSPTTTLALGRKYYVVPINTVRKLQLKYSHLQSGDIQSNDHEYKATKMDGDHNKIECFSCWLMRNNKNGHKAKKDKKLCLKNSSDKKKVSSTKRASRKSPGATISFSLTSLNHWQPDLESIVEE